MTHESERFERRFRLASWLAPAAPPVLTLVMVLAAGVPEHWSLFSLVFSVPLSYLSFWEIAVPTMRLLKRRNRLDLPSVVALGAFAGVVVYYAFAVTFSAMLGSRGGIMPLNAVIFPWGGLGALFGMLFGLVAGLPIYARGGRPSR